MYKNQINSVAQTNRQWNSILSLISQEGIVKPQDATRVEPKSFEQFLNDRADEGWVERSAHLSGGWQAGDRARHLIQLSPRATYQLRRGVPFERVRTDIIERDGSRCTVCRRFEFQIQKAGYHLEVHHIQPVREGGRDEPANLCTVCESCHKNVIHGHGIRLAPEVGTGPGASWLVCRFLSEMAVIEVDHMYKRDCPPYEPGHVVKTLRQLEKRGLVRRLELESHPANRRHTYCVEEDHEHVLIQYPHESREELSERAAAQFGPIR